MKTGGAKKTMKRIKQLEKRVAELERKVAAGTTTKITIDGKAIAKGIVNPLTRR